MNQLSDNQSKNITTNKCASVNSEIPVTAEEDVEFDLLANRQSASSIDAVQIEHIAKMVEVAGRCPTTSLSGICTELYHAGCRFSGDVWPE